MRIDKHLAQIYGSRSKAAAALSKGLVLVNGKSVNASYELRETDRVEILTANENYVSAGGFKLSKALKDFDYSVAGKVYADVGASTGGFTHCLLQNGAKKVYCIDVGESQLDKSLISDKVVVIDNFNARNLSRELFSDKLDGAVIDVSFISLTYILGAVSGVLEEGGEVLALIKPQFECESKKVGKNGIVKDEKQRLNAVQKIYNFAISVCLSPVQLTAAPVVKGKNIEYILLMKKGVKAEQLNNILKSALI